MKKLISLTILFLALVVPQCLKAYELPFDLTGFYLTGNASCNIIEIEKRHGAKLSLDEGYNLSTGIGYRFCNNFRVEGEFAYRNNHLRRVKFSRRILDAVESESSELVLSRRNKISGYYETFAGLANVYYDLPTCWCLKPYVGAGIGYGYSKIKVRKNDFTVKGHRDGFAWQVIAGVAYPIYDHIDLAVEYRFFCNESNRKIDNHDIGASLRYFF